MKIAYFDCFSGASGNMILGSLIDAGLDVNKLKSELKKLKITGYGLRIRKMKKGGISSTYLDVKTGPVKTRLIASQRRDLKNITRLIKRSSLSKPVKEKSIAIFTRLAKAEANIHGTKTDKIHFHEVGAVDAIIDIVGAVIALELLEIEKVYSSPLPLSHGFVDCEHGRLPVPAPATMELLKGIPVYETEIDGELVTPTGAAILSQLAEFKNHPQMTVKATGYGAGYYDYKMPNLLRVMIGKRVSALNDEVYVIETNIDDLNPQIYEYTLERLFAAGALDAGLTNIIMKKSRPAVKLEVIVKEKDLSAVKKIIFEETTAIGLRISKCEREILERVITPVKTGWGTIRVKTARSAGKTVNIMPEY
ncbi:MAG: nickel pincer cofactor biosynthesis protein LarC, partial [Candidatus Margulisiibacteriota bacterium]